MKSLLSILLLAFCLHVVPKFLKVFGNMQKTQPTSEKGLRLKATNIS